MRHSVTDTVWKLVTQMLENEFYRALLLLISKLTTIYLEFVIPLKLGMQISRFSQTRERGKGSLC